MPRDSVAGALFKLTTAPSAKEYTGNIMVQSVYSSAIVSRIDAFDKLGVDVREALKGDHPELKMERIRKAVLKHGTEAQNLAYDCIFEIASQCNDEMGEAALLLAEATLGNRSKATEKKVIKRNDNLTVYTVEMNNVRILSSFERDLAEKEYNRATAEMFLKGGCCKVEMLSFEGRSNCYKGISKLVHKFERF